MTLALVSDVVTIPSIAASTLEVRRRWSRWSLRQDGQLLAHLLGITRREASALRRALRRLALGPAIADAVAWHGEVVRVLTAARAEQRWVTTEAVDALLGARPEPGLLGRVRAAGYEEPLTEGQLEAVSSLDADLEELVTLTNEEVTAAELSSRKTFFDTVEKSPLTEEQARAVVCFDSRAQVLAGLHKGFDEAGPGAAGVLELVHHDQLVGAVHIPGLEVASRPDQHVLEVDAPLGSQLPFPLGKDLPIKL